MLQKAEEKVCATALPQVKKSAAQLKETEQRELYAVLFLNLRTGSTVIMTLFLLRALKLQQVLEQMEKQFKALGVID